MMRVRLRLSLPLSASSGVNYKTVPPSTARPEIVFELSDDGEAYVPMEFYYKPGDIDAMPSIVAPHQVRGIWTRDGPMFRVHARAGGSSAHCHRHRLPLEKMVVLLTENHALGLPPASPRLANVVRCAWESSGEPMDRLAHGQNSAGTGFPWTPSSQHPIVWYVQPSPVGVASEEGKRCTPN